MRNGESGRFGRWRKEVYLEDRDGRMVIKMVIGRKKVGW